MSRSDDAELIRQLTAVIRWELDAQSGIGRELEQVPALVADSILDYFDVRLRDGAEVKIADDGSLR